jgi:hypothetical protein
LVFLFIDQFLSVLKIDTILIFESCLPLLRQRQVRALGMEPRPNQCSHATWDLKKAFNFQDGYKPKASGTGSTKSTEEPPTNAR